MMDVIFLKETRTQFGHSGVFFKIEKSKFFIKIMEENKKSSMVSIFEA